MYTLNSKMSGKSDDLGDELIPPMRQREPTPEGPFFGRDPKIMALHYPGLLQDVSAGTQAAILAEVSTFSVRLDALEEQCVTVRNLAPAADAVRLAEFEVKIGELTEMAEKFRLDFRQAKGAWYERVDIEMFGPLARRKPAGTQIETVHDFEALAPPLLGEAVGALTHRNSSFQDEVYLLSETGRRDTELQAFLDRWFDQFETQLATVRKSLADLRRPQPRNENPPLSSFSVENMDNQLNLLREALVGLQDEGDRQISALLGVAGGAAQRILNHAPAGARETFEATIAEIDALRRGLGLPTPDRPQARGQGH